MIKNIFLEDTETAVLKPRRNLVESESDSQLSVEQLVQEQDSLAEKLRSPSVMQAPKST